MKKVKAVAPYIYPGQINFKHKPYEAWKKLGLPIAQAHYPWRWLHRLFFNYSFPRLCTRKHEARVCFVQPWSLYFDTFPSYLCYEIIPFFWDVWPSTYPKVEAWLRRYDVKTAIFTASATVAHMKQVFPDMNILWCPEGIDIENYSEGKELKDREIDLLEFGRDIVSALHGEVPKHLNYLHSKPGIPIFPKQEDFDRALVETKVVVAYPRSALQPEMTGGIETLTQRYWEAMLSREVMVGRAPQELIDLIGCNPVIDLDPEKDVQQVEDIISNIESYQALVDKNRETALHMAPWEIRMEQLKDWLESLGYK